MDFLERFQAVIRHHTTDTRRWTELEKLSEIPAASWNRAFSGKQRPTADMLQTIARLWPEYIFWLMTGVTDAEHGHVACRRSSRSGKSFYPERPLRQRKAAKKYFLHLIHMFTRMYGDEEVYESDSEELQAHVELTLLKMARRNEENVLNDTEAPIEDVLKSHQLALQHALTSKQAK